MEALVSVFGFWPVLIFALLGYWLGKKGGKTALAAFCAGAAVFTGCMVVGLGPAGRDGLFLVYVAFAAFAGFFSAVTGLSYLYHSGLLGKVFTPNKSK